MDSPHFQLATQVQEFVTSWAATNWTGAVAEAGFRIEKFSQMITASQPTLLAIMPTSVIDDVDGQAVGMDQDLITISVLVLSLLDDARTATIADIDSKTNTLRRKLKTFESSGLIVDGDALVEVPERRSVNYVGVYDAMELNADIFASAIEMQFAICTGDL